MSLPYSLVVLVATVTATQPVTQDMPMPITVVSKADIISVKARERSARREWASKCQRVWAARDRLDVLFANPTFAGKVRQLAAHFRYGDAGCRKDLTLALALMERLIPSHQLLVLADQSYLTDLIQMYTESRAPEATTRVQELKRLLWLRGTFYGIETELGWTEAERLAFVTRPDVWKYLNTQGRTRPSASNKIAMGLLSPASPEYDPERGVSFVEDWSKGQPEAYYVTWAARLLVEGTSVARDDQRAEALLWTIAAYDETACAMILPLVAVRLASPDSSVQDRAAASLLKLLQDRSGRENLPASNALRAALVPYFSARLESKDRVTFGDALTNLTGFAVAEDAKATSLVVNWLDRQLRGNRLEKKTFAWQSVATLARAGNPSGLRLLEADIIRTGGIVDLGLVGESNNFTGGFILSDDYPPAALRNGEEGVVSMTLLVAPNGRGIQAVVTKGASKLLDAEVAKLAARRIAKLKFRDHPGRYVRVRLPDIQFRLGPSCGDAAPAAIVSGAIVVDGHCRQPIVLDVPIS